MMALFEQRNKSYQNRVQLWNQRWTSTDGIMSSHDGKQFFLDSYNLNCHHPDTSADSSKSVRLQAQGSLERYGHISMGMRAARGMRTGLSVFIVELNGVSCSSYLVRSAAC